MKVTGKWRRRLMVKKVLSGIVLVSMVLLQSAYVCAQSAEAQTCHALCYKHYSELFQKATTKQEKDKILALQKRCPEDCKSGREFVPENPSEQKK
jgi:uncharacterized iron-regulated protein